MAKKKIEVDEDMLKEIMAGDIPIFGRTKQKENAPPPAESKPAEVVETPTEEKPPVAVQEKVSVKPKKRKEAIVFHNSPNKNTSHNRYERYFQARYLYSHTGQR